MSDRKYEAKVIGVTAATRVSVPGPDGKSLVVGREPTVIMEAQREALLAIAGGDEVPIQPKNFQFDPLPLPIPEDFPEAETLQAAGYETVEDVADATPGQLEAIKGIGESKAEDILEAADQLTV